MTVIEQPKKREERIGVGGRDKRTERYAEKEKKRRSESEIGSEKVTVSKRKETIERRRKRFTNKTRRYN